MTMKSINPATGQVLKTFETLTSAEIKEKLARAQEAFLQYRKTEFSERAYWMKNAAQLLESQIERFARLMTQEMGKPIQSARAEAKKCAWVCRYYAENAQQFLSDEVVETDAALSYIRYQPLGPVLAVMPWNFPFWQVFRFAAPGLMAGNVGLLKHASNVPQCALAIEAIFQEAGFPEGVFQTLLIGSDQVARVLDDARIVAATLTGSEPAGSSVAMQAGKLIKKTVLELGGSDPFIVMPSADLQQAIQTAVKARNINNGQSCIAAKRFIIHEAVYESFTQGFLEGMRALKIGDPLDEQVDIGPLATEGILQGLDEQVRQTLENGARALLGGEPLEREGNYYPPTVLVDIPEDSPAYQEELFGPVASLFKVSNLEEAMRVANDTKFGLGSSAWTNDKEERERFVNGLQAGNVFINSMVASDPRLPFGGVKRSGYGRELSQYGIREFVNIKTVSIQEGRGKESSETE